ncbi:MAG: hypothetical protein ACH0QD_04635 [Tepidibacillus sp.]
MMEGKKTARSLLIFALLIGVVFAIHAYYVSHYGDGKYYVNLYPGDGVKNYRVLADVSKEGEYYINKAYFPNGGFITFENAYAITPIQFNNKIEIHDDQNRTWYVELTPLKKNPPHALWKLALGYLLFFLGLALYFIDWTLVLIFGEEEENTTFKKTIFDYFMNFLDRFPNWLLLTGYWLTRGLGLLILAYLIFF